MALPRIPFCLDDHVADFTIGRQTGSSIIPGKINPVIPEVINQVAFEVIGNDLTITFAAEAGQLQLNAFEPVIAYSLFPSLDHLRAACITLERNCIRGITANEQALRENVMNSIGIIAALNPYTGYERSTTLALEAHTTGHSIHEFALENGLATPALLEKILQPEQLIGPRS